MISVLERCPYQYGQIKSITQLRFSVQLSIIKRKLCPYQRRVQEMSVLETCPSQRNVLCWTGICIRNVSVLERCLYQREVFPYQRDAHIREVFVLERCMSVLARCPYQRYFYVRDISMLERCLWWRVVRKREVSVLERCPC